MYMHNWQSLFVLERDSALFFQFLDSTSNDAKWHKAFSESVVTNCSNKQLVSGVSCLELGEHVIAKTQGKPLEKNQIFRIWKWLDQLSICFR